MKKKEFVEMLKSLLETKKNFLNITRQKEMIEKQMSMQETLTHCKM